MADIYEIPIEYEVSFSCNMCGNKLKERTSFCPRCGNKVDRSLLLNNMKNEEVRVSRIMEQLKARRIELAKEKSEKEQQIQMQIIQAQSKVKKLRIQSEMSDKEAVPEDIKKINSECEQLKTIREESRRLYENRKRELDSQISKDSAEINILKKNQQKLLEKVEMSELFCPICGTFTGKKKYCGKCGYLMRKGKTKDAVSKV